MNSAQLVSESTLISTSANLLQIIKISKLLYKHVYSSTKQANVVQIINAILCKTA